MCFNKPEGIYADKFGNVYVADSSNTRYRVILGPQTYNSVTNPLWAVIQLNSTYSTAHAGYVYPILGGGTACSGKLDNAGNGCPWYQTTTGTGNDFGVYGDPYGDIVFTDAKNSPATYRVLYMGGSKMANIITVNNSSVSTPVVGSVYAIFGAGGTGLSSPTTQPIKGTTSSTPTSSLDRVYVDSNYNVWLGDEKTPYYIFFLDGNTGYVRELTAGGGASSCSWTSQANGDGCAVNSGSTPQAAFISDSDALSLAVDNVGNLYVADSETAATAARVRKILASTLYSSPVADSHTQNLLIHEPACTSSCTYTAVLTVPTPDITLGSLSCTGNTTSSDNTYDCTLPVTVNTQSPNMRSEGLAVTGPGGTTIFPLNILSSGTALVSDTATSTGATGITATSTALGSTSYTPIAVAVDGSNNVYSVDNATNKVAVYIPSGSLGAGTTTLVTQTAPSGTTQVAVDTYGNLYAVKGDASVYKLTVTAAQGSPTAPPTFSSGTVSAPAGTLAQGVAVDVQGNLYVSDGNTKTILKISQGTNSSIPVQTLTAAFSNPTLLTLDTLGNLWVYDAGANSIYKMAIALNKGPGAVALPTATVTSVTATGLAVDAAGNLYVQTSSGVTEYPSYTTSGPASVTVYSGGTTPKGIALDGAGNLYYADAGNTAVQEIARSTYSYNFGTSTTPTLASTISNAGNLAATGFGALNSNFITSGGSSNGCGGSGALATSTATAIGQSCVLTVQYNGGLATDTIAFTSTSALSTTTANTGSAAYSGTAGSAVATTTALSGQTPGSPNYAPSGTEVSFTVTVTAGSGSAAPTGTVNWSVDSGVYTGSVTLSPVGGQIYSTATIALSGEIAGSHSLAATYAGATGFNGSTTSSGSSYTIAQVATSMGWTPGASSLQVSAPLGTSVLNATCSGAPTAYITYTATPSGGSAQNVDAATYLPLSGSPYSLVATCTPADGTDYTGSTASMSSLTITQATTTAPIGGTQFLVASSGGNYTSVQAAVNAIGASGGNIYIAPGTYTERVTVMQPSVALRGLGGNPQNVVLTHEAGAFSASGNSGYAGEFTTALTNGYQLPAGSSTFSGDAGSSTLNISKGINTAINSSTTYYPHDFYAENLSVNNTWDSDATTTTTTYNVGGVCTASAGAAQTYNALFNAGIQCASQAIALWDASDQSVFNNVYTFSLQDTVYAGSGGCGAPCTVGREYWYHGKITGDVDYIFGDGAAVFDHMNIYSVFHSTATGAVTIEAQNKSAQTGSGSDYLSGYVFYNDTMTSQATGMTALTFGRPWGAYSTAVLLNDSIDQVAATGWSAWSGNNNLATSTYLEFNDIAYTDPSTGSADINGVIYTGSGGNTGSGVTGTRETTSTNPGTAEASNNPITSMSYAQSSQFQPVNFLNSKVGTSGQGVTGGVGTLSTGGTSQWNPVTAIATDVNAFTNSGTSSYTITYGNSITILMRPTVPGAGLIPTGTYTLKDNGSTIASGSLDATGEAYYTSTTLVPGSHSFTWVYGGDSNFAGSTTAGGSALSVTVNAIAETVTPNSQTVTWDGTVPTLGYSISPSMTPSTLPTCAISDGTHTDTAGGTVNLTPGTYSAGVSCTGAAATGYSFSYNTAGVTVNVATLNSITVSGFPKSINNGTSEPVTVTAKDSSGNAIAGYTGTVTLSSSDGSATLPSAYTYSAGENGVHQFSVALNTSGTQSITATIGSTTGSETGIDVGTTLWVVNANGTLSKLSSQGNAVSGSGGISGGGSNSSTQGAAAPDSSGNIWSVDSGNNQLTKFAASGSSGTSYTNGGLNAPTGVIVDGGGSVWVSNSGGNSVSQFGTGGSAVTGSTGYTSNLGNGNSALNQPTGIAVDAAGVIWVTNGGNNTVTQIIGPGTPVVTPTVNALKNNTYGVKP